MKDPGGKQRCHAEGKLRAAAARGARVGGRHGSRVRGPLDHAQVHTRSPTLAVV